MLQTVLLNKKGLTLVEVMIALVVLLLVFLALMQTALVSIDSNMINVMRDEAVNIAEGRMYELRNLSFDDSDLNDTDGNFITENDIPKAFRNASVTFTPSRKIDDINTDSKQVDITVTWEWKERTTANGDPYTHTISTVLRRQ